MKQSLSWVGFLSGLVFMVSVVVSCSRNLAVPVNALSNANTSTSTPTLANTATSTSTATMTNTSTPNGPTNTQTSTPTATNTATLGNTSTSTSTATVTNTPQATNTQTSTCTMTNTNTPMPTATPSNAVDYDNWNDGGDNATYDGCPLIVGAGNAYSGCLANNPTNSGNANVDWLLGPPWFGGTTSGSMAVTNTLNGTSLPGHNGETNSLAVTLSFDSSADVANINPECWSTFSALTSMTSQPTYVSFWVYVSNGSGPITISNMEIISGTNGSTEEESKYSGINQQINTTGAWLNFTEPTANFSLILDTGGYGAVQWNDITGVAFDITGPASTTQYFAITDIYFYP